MSSSRASRFIRAPIEVVYRAFTEADALVAWMAPGEMTGQIHDFEARVGSGYRMSLFYPPSEPVQRGKTADREDRYTARYIELSPPRKIVQAIDFDSPDPAFLGEMSMTTSLTELDEGTEVTIQFDQIPPGIRPEDSEEGTRASLEKLARYVERHAASES